MWLATFVAGAVVDEKIGEITVGRNRGWSKKKWIEAIRKRTRARGAKEETVREEWNGKIAEPLMCGVKGEVEETVC